MKVFTSPAIWHRRESDSRQCDLSGVHYRIGSTSTRAMVFKVVVDGIAAAVKVLLATEANPSAQIASEIAITTYLGEKYPEFFTPVFRVEKCDDVKIPAKIANLGLIEDAHIYHIQQLISSLSKRERKMLEIEYRATHDARVYEQYWDGLLPALLMFSELGSVDLKTWSESKHSAREWDVVIDSVLAALEILRHEKITHNDLHHGNILLIFDANMEAQIKLIDFGEALNEYEAGRDLETFLQGFSYIKNLPKSIQARIDILSNHQ